VYIQLITKTHIFTELRDTVILTQNSKFLLVLAWL